MRGLSLMTHPCSLMVLISLLYWCNHQVHSLPTQGGTFRGCPRGFYTEGFNVNHELVPSAAHCQPCPDNTYNSEEGLNIRSQCTECTLECDPEREEEVARCTARTNRRCRCRPGYRNATQDRERLRCVLTGEEIASHALKPILNKNQIKKELEQIDHDEKPNAAPEGPGKGDGWSRSALVMFTICLTMLPVICILAIVATIAYFRCPRQSQPPQHTRDEAERMVTPAHGQNFVTSRLAPARDEEHRLNIFIPHVAPADPPPYEQARLATTIQTTGQQTCMQPPTSLDMSASTSPGTNPGCNVRSPEVCGYIESRRDHAGLSDGHRYSCHFCHGCVTRGQGQCGHLRHSRSSTSVPSCRVRHSCDPDETCVKSLVDQCRKCLSSLASRQSMSCGHCVRVQCDSDLHRHHNDGRCVPHQQPLGCQSGDLCPQYQPANAASPLCTDALLGASEDQTRSNGPGSQQHGVMVINKL